MPKASKSINKRDTIFKIRSKYILRQIFENIHKKRKLDIVRFNKNIQKSLDVELNDYKIEYSKIEIEIIPREYKYGKFINILNKKNEPYYHIFFNDEKEEIKSNKINRDEIFHDGLKVDKMRIVIDHKIKSLFQLFKNCKCIQKINFIKFNRDDIKNFSHMFEQCISLEELDISKLKMDNATDISYMFSDCHSLKQLNLPKFNCNNATNLSSMFYKCYQLKEINMKNFMMKNAENMSSMFYECSF